MPDTLPGWLWWIYYTGGALGGLGFIALATPILIEESVRIIKKRRAK